MIYNGIVHTIFEDINSHPQIYNSSDLLCTFVKKIRYYKFNLKVFVYKLCCLKKLHSWKKNIDFFNKFCLHFVFH